MPIFEYECRACKKVFEELVMGSQYLVACPGCGSKNVKKLISATCRREAGQDLSAPLPAGGGGCSHKGFS